VNGFKPQAIFFLALAISLSGCTIPNRSSSSISDRPFQISDLAKSDVDLVLEMQLNYSLEYLKELMIKLYKRNPKEWGKGGGASAQQAINRVFGPGRAISFPQLHGKRSIDAMRLAFDEGFYGDRVLALVEGLRGMIFDSYNGKREFFLLDELDPQKLYNAARNIEIAAWKLNHDRNGEGQLFLITNELSGPVQNLSFERLLGKMIAVQDSTARFVAQSTNRRVKNVIQSIASAVFIPI
jgi:hypothetical protein